MSSRYSQTTCHLQVDQTTIPYCLQRSSRRRTMAIMIKDDGLVKVYAPKSLPDERIRHFISEKSGWILDSVRRISLRSSDHAPRYQDGGEFLFLGEKYPIRILEANGERSRIEFHDSSWRIFLTEHQPEVIRQMLEGWYRDQAKEFLAGRLLQWARRMEADVKEIHVRSQKRLWGCCYPRQKKIHLNWHIIMAPVEAIDYVIVHELCHLFVPDHSRKFWQLVAEHYPNYLAQKRWFKENSLRLRLEPVR